MEFRTATDRLNDQGVTLQEIADALGVSYASVKQARMDSTSPSYRNPPDNWRPRLAKLAKVRGGDLQDLAEELGTTND